MKRLQVAIGSLCALAPTFLTAQTASLTFPLDILEWSYYDSAGDASGQLEAKTSASPQLTKNLQGSTGIEVNWVAPDCKVFRLVLPANINNDLEFVPFVNEGAGAYSTPWTNISSSALQLKTLITSGVTSPSFAVFDGFTVTVASDNDGKVDISGAFDSTFSDPAGTVFKFRGVTLTGAINSSLNVTNRTVNPVLRMQMDFDNTVTSDPGAPMTIVDACPAAPTNLVATPLAGAAQISFVAGTDNGSAITNYAYSVDGGAFTPLASPDSQSPITIPNLTNGQEHSIVFRAINAIGEGANSNAISVTPQPDSDGDGVLDNVDAFPNDPNESTDSDRDGVGDNGDQCANTPSSETADSSGCGPSQRDPDGDGVNDDQDAFPNDPNETADSDGDGVGDNADAFPNDPTRSALPAMPVPLMPAVVLLLLAGLLGLLGIRRLKL